MPKMLNMLNTFWVVKSLGEPIPEGLVFNILFNVDLRMCSTTVQHLELNVQHLECSVYDR